MAIEGNKKKWTEFNLQKLFLSNLKLKSNPWRPNSWDAWFTINKLYTGIANLSFLFKQKKIKKVTHPQQQNASLPFFIYLFFFKFPSLNNNKKLFIYREQEDFFFFLKGTYHIKALTLTSVWSQLRNSNLGVNESDSNLCLRNHQIKN